MKARAKDSKGRSEAGPNQGNFCTPDLDFQQTPGDREVLGAQAEQDKGQSSEKSLLYSAKKLLEVLSLWHRSPAGVNSTEIKGIMQGFETACEKGL